MEPPAIQIRELAARFGGLTAIASLDLAIERGSITSIVGPNGAGKTTLFNCVSGVLTPTRGMILVAGRDVRRGWRMATTWACLGVAMLTAAVCGSLALNVNGLWRAAIRRPHHFSPAPFSRSAMYEGAAGYWRGELAIERGSLGRWNIVAADGGTLLNTVETLRQARHLRDQYERLRRSPPADLKVIRSRNNWLLVNGAASANPGPTFASRQAATDRRELLISLAQAGHARRRRTYIATLSGLLLGALGMISVWRRTRWTPEVVAAAGVARTFQNLRLFSRLSVLENVLVACESQGRRQPQVAALQLLDLVGLRAVAQFPAGQLAYGDRRRLEIARALGQRPWLLLLDEPAAGMNPTEKARLGELIRRLRHAGITIVLIEHEMNLVMGISDRVVVLAGGRVIAAGSPEAVRRDPLVLEAYLGTPTP
ncbi:MAG TPA: ATP-binding cassette domain-containing protein [Pirellulales bacterium]